MILEFAGDVIHWRGPSPYHFVRVPDDDGAEIKEIAAALTYGWGVIPVTVSIGDTEWTTSLFPKDGSYLVPLKDAARRAEELEVGETISVRLTLGG